MTKNQEMLSLQTKGLNRLKKSQKGLSIGILPLLLLAILNLTGCAGNKPRPVYSLVDDFRFTEIGNTMTVGKETLTLSKQGAWVSNDWMNNIAQVNGVGGE